MACRPADDDDAPTSKIFKSLGDSEAGRSFRNMPTQSGQGSFTKGRPSGQPGNSSFSKRSNREVDGEEDVRSLRANGAMRLRESMVEQKRKLPRGQTFERKKAAEDAYADDEEDEENISPNKRENKPQKGKHSASVDGVQQSLNARFKSKTGAKTGTNDSDEEFGDDDVIASA